MDLLPHSRVRIQLGFGSGAAWFAQTDGDKLVWLGEHVYCKDYRVDERNGLNSLFDQIIRCKRCPRLRSHCERMAKIKRRAFQEQRYWGRPITGFGDLQAGLILVGLAPAAHGANRTGRIFTGDQSGFWLYRALFKHGFANQFSWENNGDGLKLKNAYVTCVVKCAPPDNRPNAEEISRCGEFFTRELLALRFRKVYVALGQIAFNTLWLTLAMERTKPRFKHATVISLPENRSLILSYHPSQQNTFTKRLTEPMFDEIFALARKLLA